MTERRTVARSTLSRVSTYLDFVSALPEDRPTISATQIAGALGLGDVLVRKDLAQICGKGKPKVGYVTKELKDSLHSLLRRKGGGAVIVGAGKIGRALLDYSGFDEFNISILAAFDKDAAIGDKSSSGKPIYGMNELYGFCLRHEVGIGIIAVPSSAAQEVCDALCKSGVRGILSFANAKLEVPEGVTVEYENIAISLAHLKMKII